MNQLKLHRQKTVNITMNSLWIVVLSLICFVISLYQILIGESAIGMSFLIFTFIGIFTSGILSGAKQPHMHNLLLLFFVNLFAYTLFSLLSYYPYLTTGQFFIYPDQYHFYEHGEKLGHFGSLSEIYRACFIDRIHLENEAAHFLHGSIAFFANKYFNGNSVLLQIIHTSFWGILIGLFIYKILHFYVPNAKAFKYSLLYSLLSPVFYYSPWILRDIHVALLYSAGIYIMHTRFSVLRLTILMLLAYITLEFRLQHGVFYVIFIGIYVFFRGKTHAYYRVILPITLIVFVFSLSLIITALWPKIEFVFRNFQSYSSYTEARVGEGFGAYLYTLPPGIKHFSIAIYSQISQFPPWVGIEKSETFVQGLIGSIELISSMFWSYVFLFLLLSMFWGEQRLPKLLLFLLVVAFIFLVSNTANMNIRRLVGIYPIIYTAFVYVKETLPQKKKRQIDVFTKTAYMLLVAIYLQLSITNLT